MGTFDGVNDGGRERVGRRSELIGCHHQRERFVDGKKLYFLDVNGVAWADPRRNNSS